MDKNGTITVSNPQNGIASSAILGNEAIIGCEIFDEPGVIKIQQALALDSSGSNTGGSGGLTPMTGVPVADVSNYNSIYTPQRTVLTSTGQLYSITNADATMASNLSQGWDCLVWDTTFTVVSYSQSGVGYIGVIYHDPSANSASWYPAKIGSLDGTHYIKLIMGKDGYMYFTNGNNLGRITNITYSLGTVTVTSSSTMSGGFVLPKNTYGVTMATLGDKLLIGTQKGYSYSARDQFGYAGLVVWDYTSANADNIIEINEQGMNAMISNKNQVYFSAGNDGNIYVTDGVNYQKIKRLPFNRSGYYVASSSVYPNAMCINQRGNLLVGLSANYDANSTTTTGVWEIGLMKDYPTHLPFFSRDGNLGQTNNVYFGTVRVLDDNNIAFGVRSGNNYELSVTTTTLNTGYTAKWRTQAYFVGSARFKKTFEQLEFMLSKQLIANQSIKISFRTNLTDDFTEIGTYTYTDLGSVLSHMASAGIADAEIVQFEIALNYTSPIFGKNINLIRTLFY